MALKWAILALSGACAFRLEEFAEQDSNSEARLVHRNLFPAQGRADFMQELQDFAEGLEGTGFVISDVVFLAVGLDDLLCPSQVVPGHAGEEMVLHLVV